MTQEETRLKKARMVRIFPSLILLIGLIFMLISFFAPFISIENSIVYKNERFSIFDQLYDLYLVYDFASEWNPVTLFLYLFTIIFIPGIFNLLTVIFILLRKAIPIIIFNTLSLLVFINYCGVLKESNYVYNGAFCFYLISSVILYAGAVWLFICNRKIKRIKKSMKASNSLSSQSVDMVSEDNSVNQ